MRDRKDNQDDFEDLLRQVDRVLEEDRRPQREDPFPEILANANRDDADEPVVYANFSNNYGRDLRNYRNHYGRSDFDDQEPDPPEPAGPAIPAYNADFNAARQQRARPQRASAAPQRRRPEPQWEPEEDEEEWEETPPRPQKKQKSRRRKKKRHGFLKFLLVLLVLVGGLLVWAWSLIRPPQGGQGPGTRKAGAATVLVCGTDEEGTRTDTMMLVYLNSKDRSVNMVSLPRDTLTHATSGKNAKLNSAYGRNGGGEEGMEALLDYVKDIVGFRPDGYMLVDLQGFVDLVDLMGGVEFDVPQDMFYEDSSQDLYIDLKAGKQKLTGYQAMGLVRFRKGYANQDLGRVEVQREFLSACMDQWLTLGKLGKLPKALSTMKASTTSSLSTGNLLWIALTAWRTGMGNIHSATLPGAGDMIDGVSYFVLDAQGVADTVNEYCNPYTRDFSTGDLNIVG